MPGSTDTKCQGEPEDKADDATEYRFDLEETAEAIGKAVRDRVTGLVRLALSKANVANDSKKKITRALDEAGSEIACAASSEAGELLKLAIIRAKAAVRDGVAETNPDAVNKRELGAIYSLIAYAVYRQNLQPEQVEALVEKEFKVDHVAHIKARDFERAVGYLLELYAFTESRYGEGVRP
jgi:hypothetical protein